MYLYKKELGLIVENDENENSRELPNKKENKITSDLDNHQINYNTTGSNSNNNKSSKEANNTIISNVIYALPRYISVACAFPGDSIHDHVWEYISLWSLQNQYNEIISTVSVKTRNSLKRFLNETTTKEIVVINEIKESDYDLAYAKIIGHKTPILPIETSNNRKVPLLLEKFAKRYIDIVNAGVINLRQFVKFNRKIMEEVNTVMNKIKIQNGFNITDNVQWIGMYIDFVVSCNLHFVISCNTHIYKSSYNRILE